MEVTKQIQKNLVIKREFSSLSKSNLNDYDTLSDSSKKCYKINMTQSLKPSISKYETKKSSLYKRKVKIKYKKDIEFQIKKKIWIHKVVYL